MKYSWKDNDMGKLKYQNVPCDSGLGSNPEIRREMPAWAAIGSGSSISCTVNIFRDTAPRKLSLTYSDQQECIHHE
jgi:hypothetical protein